MLARLSIGCNCGCNGGKWEGLANDDFVRAQEAKYRTGLFVKKIEIQVIVREPMRQVLHAQNIRLKTSKIQAKLFGLCLDLDPPK